MAWEPELVTRIELLIAWLLLSGLVAVYLYLTGCHGTMVSSACLMVNLGAASTLIGLIVLPAPRQGAMLITNCLAVVTTFTMMFLAFSKGQMSSHTILQGTIAVFSINFLLHSLSALLTGLNSIKSTAPALVALFTLLVGSNTLWLGPSAEWYAMGDGPINTIIASNPLSYLSVAAEYDYLRSDWFYRHSPFGSLRFTYPDLALLTTTYLGLAALMLGVAYSLRTKKRIEKPHSSPTNIRR